MRHPEHSKPSHTHTHTHKPFGFPLLLQQQRTLTHAMMIKSAHTLVAIFTMHRGFHHLDVTNPTLFHGIGCQGSNARPGSIVKIVHAIREGRFTTHGTTAKLSQMLFQKDVHGIDGNGAGSVQEYEGNEAQEKGGQKNRGQKG